MKQGPRHRVGETPTKPKPKLKPKPKAGASQAAPPVPPDRFVAMVAAVAKARSLPVKQSRTAKLFGAGRRKIAQKVVEEAAEVAIDATAGDRRGVINETADLLYNLAILLAEAEIDPEEVWAEVDRRSAMFEGVPEKLRKGED